MPHLFRRCGLAGLLVIGLAACGENPSGHPPPENRSFELPLAHVGTATIDRLYSTPGSVVSDERVEVSSRTTGYIQSLTVNEGDVISKGYLLVEIDPTDVDGAISSAESALGSARTALVDAESDVARLTDLLDKGAVSNETLRKARVVRDVARTQLNEAQTALDTALAGRKYTSLTSSIDGIVVARHKNVGDLATPGVAIITIESRARLLFRTFVSESRVADVHVGDQLRVEIDALGQAEVFGNILRIIPSADTVTRKYDVEIALPPDLDVFPGMFGRAHFIIGSEQITVVPPSALTERAGLTGVFVVDDADTAHFRWLKTAREVNGDVEVTGGLVGNETIVARSHDQLRDGDTIAASEGMTGHE